MRSERMNGSSNPPSLMIKWCAMTALIKVELHSVQCPQTPVIIGHMVTFAHDTTGRVIRNKNKVGNWLLGTRYAYVNQWNIVYKTHYFKLQLVKGRAFDFSAFNQIFLLCSVSWNNKNFVFPWKINWNSSGAIKPKKKPHSHNTSGANNKETN